MYVHCTYIKLCRYSKHSYFILKQYVMLGRIPHLIKRLNVSLLKPNIAINHFKLIGINLIEILNHVKTS